jgi:hypothetical protein
MTTAVSTDLQNDGLKIELVKWQGMSIEAERMAGAVVITDDFEEIVGVDTLSKIKQFQKETEAARKEHVEPFNRLVKRVNDMFRPISESLSLAEDTIKGKIKHYRVEKERIRQAEEAKRRKEFEAQIEAEKQKAKEENREQAIVAPPPVILPSANTSRGEIGSASIRKIWKAEVVDLLALCRAIGEGKVAPDCIEIKMAPLHAAARRFKRDNMYPGVRFFEDTEVSAR